MMNAFQKKLEQREKSELIAMLQQILLQRARFALAAYDFFATTRLT